MKKILVFCTANSCRSQIAEGYLRHIGGDKALIKAPVSKIKTSTRAR